jgi:hypothetical protein
MAGVILVQDSVITCSVILVAESCGYMAGVILVARSCDYLAGIILV